MEMLKVIRIAKKLMEVLNDERYQVIDPKGDGVKKIVDPRLVREVKEVEVDKEGYAILPWRFREDFYKEIFIDQFQMRQDK